MTADRNSIWLGHIFHGNLLSTIYFLSCQGYAILRGRDGQWVGRKEETATLSTQFLTLCSLPSPSPLSLTASLPPDVRPSVYSLSLADVQDHGGVCGEDVP